MLLCTENNFLLCVFPLSEEKRKGKQSRSLKQTLLLLCCVFVLLTLWSGCFLPRDRQTFLPFHACFMHQPQTKQIHFISQANKAKQSNAQAQPALYLLPMFSDSAASSMCKIKHRFKYLSPSCLLAFHVILGFFYSWDFHSLHSKRGRKKKLNLWRKLRLSSISRFIWRSRGKKDF